VRDELQHANLPALIETKFVCMFMAVSSLIKYITLLATQIQPSKIGYSFNGTMSDVR
jgi:hypothetical protein